MNEIKRLMAEFEAAEAKVNALDDLYEENPEDEKLEAEWMEAYKEERRTCKALVDWIGAKTGRINERESRAIIYGMRDEFKALIDRLA